MVHVACEARRPDRDTGPEAWRVQTVLRQICRGGGRREVRGKEEAVGHVEGYGGCDYDEVRFRARWGAERGYEGAVEVVYKIECGKDEWGLDTEGGAREAR